MFLLIFEGVDRSGKTLLRKGVSEFSNHRWLTTDRWIHSHLVYGSILRNYEADENDMIISARMSLLGFEGHLVVITEPDPKVVVTRRVASNPELVKADLSGMEREVIDHMKAYRVAARKMPFYENTVLLNTDNRLDQSCGLVLEFMKQIEMFGKIVGEVSPTDVQILT